MSGLLKSDKQIVSAKVSMNILCEECIKDLKQNLYEGKNFVTKKTNSVFTTKDTLGLTEKGKALLWRQRPPQQ